jgi:hypothetical protein
MYASGGTGAGGAEWNVDQRVQDVGAVAAAGKADKQGRHVVAADRGAPQVRGGLDRGGVTDQQAGDGKEFVRASRARLATGVL